MRAHRVELLEQPWRTVVRIRFPDPADRALQLFLNERRHRGTLALLEDVLAGRVDEAATGGDRTSVLAGPRTAVVTDRLADLLGPQEAADDVTLATEELRDLLVTLLDARAANSRRARTDRGGGSVPRA